jgi:hypothetical protein
MLGWFFPTGNVPKYLASAIELNDSWANTDTWVTVTAPAGWVPNGFTPSRRIGLAVWPAGLWTIKALLSASDVSMTTLVRVSLFRRTTGDVNTELCTQTFTITSTSATEYTATFDLAESYGSTEDSLYVLYEAATANTDVVTVHFWADSPVYSRFETPLGAGPGLVVANDPATDKQGTLNEVLDVDYTLSKSVVGTGSAKKVRLGIASSATLSILRPIQRNSTAQFSGSWFFAASDLETCTLDFTQTLENSQWQIEATASVLSNVDGNVITMSLYDGAEFLGSVDEKIITTSGRVSLALSYGTGTKASGSRNFRLILHQGFNSTATVIFSSLSVVEYNNTDVATLVLGPTGPTGPSGSPGNATYILVPMGGPVNHNFSTPRVCRGIYIDPSLYSVGLSWYFSCVANIRNPSTSATVRLINLTDATVAATITVNQISITNYSVAATIAAAAKIYEVQIFMNGSPNLNDGVFLCSADLSYR